MQSNPNARNYLLSQAIELKGGSMMFETERPLSMIHGIPVRAIFEALTVRTDPVECIGYNKKVVFHFTDTDEKWTVWLRQGVTEIQPFALDNPDITVTATENHWKEISAGVRSPLTAIASGKLSIEGGLGEFRTFFGKFKR